MNKRKLAKLKKELASLQLRKGNITAKEMVRFAKKCGRNRRPGGIGKEPTYISDLPYTKPLSIPGHPGNLRPGTAGNILDILEQDLLGIEDKLEQTHEEQHEQESR
jgi:hypothetical protein